ncbi:MAG: glycosyltransferase family 2 protein [Candidatus Kapabacteria bacterium]|nr:glycosyltransferase family 2 protein [Candidatus Kapabacteria bacterium]
MNSSLLTSTVLHTSSSRPFFSVIMCTFNRAALLPRALDSLIAQTERDWELIVVDDGSTDDTVSVVQKYAAGGLPCRLIWHTNRGTGMSRNIGIMASSGLFVTFLDSDDAYAPDHLQSRKQILLEYPSIEFIHGGVTVIGEPTVADRHDPSRTIPISECVVGGTFVIRRDTVFQLGGFDAVRYADDALLYERAYSKGISIARTDHPSYIYYRDTPDSLCSTYGT